MTAARRCPRCPRLIPADVRYCPEHAVEYEARRGTSASRGYGQPHQAKRREYAARMARGETFTCHRCDQPINPGQAWDLGHTDDRTAWAGPEHAGCNRATGGRNGATIANSRH